MRISKLNIEDFGKFHGKNLHCSSGMNLLSGANESGKTTIRRFFCAMFYGLERERGIRAKTDDYTRYLPWEYGKYQGSMEFEADGITYRLFRNFLTTNKECHLINLTTGREVPQPDVFLRQMGLISEQAYCNTLCVGNFCSTGAELAEEVQNYLANLALTGGANVDVSGAITRLNDQKRELQRSLPERELSEQREYLRQEDALKQRYQELLTLRQELELRRSLTDTSRKVYQKEQERLFSVEQNNDEFLSYLVEEKLTETFPLSEWMSTKKEQETRSKYAKTRSNQVLSLLAPGALCILIAMLLPIKSLTLALAGGSTMLCGWILFGLFRYQSKRFSNEALEWSRQITNKKTEFIHQRLQLTQNEIKRTIDEMQQLLPSIEKNNFELEHCEEEMAGIELAKEQVSELMQKYQHIKSEMTAIDLAIQSLTELSGKLYDEFGARFGQTLSKYAVSFTNGIYHKLAADENLQLRAITEKRTVSVNQVSYGTAEQFSLSLRLAAADAFDPLKKLPLILDDSFASFDEQRLESALVCLSKCGRQVFLFSSTGREERIAKRMGIAYEADFDNIRAHIEESD